MINYKYVPSSFEPTKFQISDYTPYIVDFIRFIDVRTSNIEPQIRLILYEGIGNMISAEKNLEKVQLYLE